MLFLVAFIIIWTVSPGPVVALTLSRANKLGYKSGIAVAGGATVSTALILAIAVIIHLKGINIVESSQSSVPQIVGGTLIILIGMNAGFKAFVSVQQNEKSPATDNAHRRSFIQGMMVLTASIPQSIMFYVILVPQTVAANNIMSVLVGLGVAKVILTFVWHATVAIIADHAQSWFSNPQLNQRFDFATAIFMVGFGINILF